MTAAIASPSSAFGGVGFCDFSNEARTARPRIVSFISFSVQTPAAVSVRANARIIRRAASASASYRRAGSSNLPPSITSNFVMPFIWASPRFVPIPEKGEKP